MASKGSIGIAVLCDHVYRDAQSNKAILAGVYSGDIRISDFPANITFALYIEFHAADSEMHNIELSFHFGRKLLANARLGAATEPKTPAILIIPAIGLQIDGPKILRINASVDGGRAKRILQKTIAGA